MSSLRDPAGAGALRTRFEQPGDAGMVMYNGTVRRLPFLEQCRAAALAQCRSLTMTPSAYFDLVAQGVSGQDQRLIASDHGIDLRHLDPFTRWTPHWIPANHAGNYDISKIACDWDEFRRIAEALGCQSFTALGTYPGGALETGELVDHFGTLCRLAAMEGLRVDLEFAPLWGLATLEQAWDIVRMVSAKNSGIMFDTWHFRRSGSSEATLASIPGHWISGVQLNDGPANVPPGRSIVEDCLYHRSPPGEGDFRVCELVAILRAINGLNNVGPEIFSTAFDSLTAEEIAARALTATKTVLQQAQ